MLTEKELKERKTRIGGSEIAALFGMDPYKSRHDLYLEKTADLLPEPEKLSDNDPRRAGNTFESGILDWAAETLGPLERNLFFQAPTGLPLATQVDGRVAETGVPVDAKVSGLSGRLDKEVWGDAGTDEVPEPYILQLQAQMYCTQQEVAHLAAYLFGKGFVLYRIERSEAIITKITEEVAKFWTEHVLAKIPPEDVPSLNTLKRIIREPKKRVAIDPLLVRSWVQAKECEKEARKDKEHYLALLITELEDAEEGDAGQQGLVTYYEQHRKGFTVKPSSFRVPRLKKNKE